MMTHRKFTFADQVAFKELSGDNNPLHMDRVAARRYIFGRPVVHGVHLVLWALDEHMRQCVPPMALESIKAQFMRPVGVEEEVQYSSRCPQPDLVELELLSSGVVSTKINAKWNARQQNGNKLRAGFPELRSPRVVSEGEMVSRSGSLDLYLNSEAAVRLFPHLSRCLFPLQLAILLSTTRLVGVECPGLNSVFFELDLSAVDMNGRTTLNYEVTRHEKSLALVVMKVMAPGLGGSIKAFVRPAPREQANYVSLKSHVSSAEFAEQRALVIGGSRGLGEIAAKLVCAGGAKVKITYHQGKDDAVRVAQEITSNGGDAGFFHFDVLDCDSDALKMRLGDWCPTHLYFFATPFIASSPPGVFNPDLFYKFCRYYVTAFRNVVNQLASAGLKNALYPSTVFIDEAPSGMGEYAAAKAAGEVLCALLERTHRGMVIRRPRLPRLPTDQTVSLRSVYQADPVPVILSELRLFSHK
jgi:acyl dehydratase